VEELLHLDVEAYKDMFIELGNALMIREQWETALECFGKIQESDDVSVLSLHR
jgi:general transcription factor 3C polypeptide 3 (transcription factor C subunit 4)